MTLHVPFLVLFLACEGLLILVFLFVAPAYAKEAKVDFKSIIKGMLERIFLTICLINQLPHALTLFGTLKLATRLKRDDSQVGDGGQAFNDYYLLGNFTSVAAAIFYYKYYPCGIC